VSENLDREGAARKLGRFVERHVVDKRGDYYLK
jgi:hypothetical protein